GEAAILLREPLEEVVQRRHVLLRERAEQHAAAVAEHGLLRKAMRHGSLLEAPSGAPRAYQTAAPGRRRRAREGLHPPGPRPRADERAPAAPRIPADDALRGGRERAPARVFPAERRGPGSGRRPGLGETPPGGPRRRRDPAAGPRGALAGEPLGAALPRPLGRALRRQPRARDPAHRRPQPAFLQLRLARRLPRRRSRRAPLLPAGRPARGRSPASALAAGDPFPRRPRGSAGDGAGG